MSPPSTDATPSDWTTSGEEGTDDPLSESDASSFISIPSSIRSALYRYENGRLHAALNEEYKWPCDAAHARFELLMARLLEMTYETGLYWEPSPGRMKELLSERDENGQGGRVADVGSGVTASWAISMAERFPANEVIGVDLVPSELEFLPPNLTIEIHDCLEGLPHPDDFFSLIHIRMLQSLAFWQSFPRFLLEVVRCLRPGGVLLLEEPEVWIQPRPHLPPYPHLPALLARHQMHGWNWAGTQPHPEGYFNFFEHMASFVRATPGFDAPGAVREASQDFGFGKRPNEGPPEKQRGTLVREIWLLAWQLDSEKQPDAERLREEDQKYIPEEDVGLFFRHRVVWAEKAGLPSG